LLGAKKRCIGLEILRSPKKLYSPNFTKSIKKIISLIYIKC